jgi:hypothetical protein
MSCKVEQGNARPLWTCPKCGHRFVTRNIWHSSGRYDLEDHFMGRAPEVRETFDRLVAAVADCGPVTVYAQKTRIVFMVRVRFGGVIARRRWLYFSLWLTRRIDHPRLDRVDEYGPNSFGHRFRLSHPHEVDSDLTSIICEAYLVGRQDHLRRAENDL